MKSINKILMKAKLKNYKKYKERDKRQVLDLNNQVTKYMANASFYRPKFKIINLMTNCWVGGQLLTLWKSLSSFLNKMKLLASELGPLENMKVVGNWVRFPGKKKRSFGFLELQIWVKHWTVFGLQDKFRHLHCCYNLDLQTAFLDLGVHMKVVGLCLTEFV